MILKIINSLMITLATLFIFGAVLSVPALALTDTGNQACEGIGLTGASCDPATSGSNATNLVETIINWFSWIVGAVSVIMVMYGGFRYVTSSGDASKIKASRDTIMYALVGLVVVALSQVLVKFVINASNEAINGTTQSQGSGSGTGTTGSGTTPVPSAAKAAYDAAQQAASEAQAALSADPNNAGLKAAVANANKAVEIAKIAYDKSLQTAQ